MFPPVRYSGRARESLADDSGLERAADLAILDVFEDNCKRRRPQLFARSLQGLKDGVYRRRLGQRGRDRIEDRECDFRFVEALDLSDGRLFHTWSGGEEVLHAEQNEFRDGAIELVRHERSCDVLRNVAPSQSVTGILPFGHEARLVEDGKSRLVHRGTPREGWDTFLRSCRGRMLHDERREPLRLALHKVVPEVDERV